MNSRSRLFPLVALALIASEPALCQQQSGTIVTFRVFPDHAIVAADSRTVRTVLDTRTVNDDVCKILTFDNKLIFAYAGYTARVKPYSDETLWNVRDVAKSAYRDIVSKNLPASNLAGSNLSDAFAREWTKRMGGILIDDSKISPPPLVPGGFVLGGIFIAFDAGGQILPSVVIFRLVNGSITAQMGAGHPDGHLNMVGRGAVFEEFEANTTKRAKQWHAQTDKLSPDKQAVALAKLTKEFDASGQVGGPIDSVILTRSGISWLYVKPHCR
jgi:hypothetical protein